MKVKARLKRILITILLLIGGFFLCHFIYVVIDRGLNGYVVDRFEEEYMSHQWVELEGGEEGYYNHRISWWRVKELLYEAFLVLIIVWVLSLRLASVLYASRREKKIIHAASGMITRTVTITTAASLLFTANHPLRTARSNRTICIRYTAKAACRILDR